MLGVQFEDKETEGLKMDVLRHHPDRLDEALEWMVDDLILNSIAKDEKGTIEDEISYEAWARWFESLPGISEVINH